MSSRSSRGRSAGSSFQSSMFEEEASDEQVDLPRSTWKEVPQALFDSWSNERQLAYCAARDEDGALYAVTMEEAQWFAARSQWYTQEMKRCQTNMTRLGEAM